MKNLKKVLALGLALVMLLGMMTVVSAADDKMTSKDLKDMDTVVNKAEVSLLVDLGVINGFEDFTFRPTETVTRAQMAKMVFYVLMGNTDASVYGGSTSKFADARGHWAEGEINYLATPGVDVVAGDDLGKFNPNATVRVAEAAKMLLVAAGWDAEDRSYVGDGWSGAIMRDANKQGLMAGVSQTALQPMTRDNAAKMIFNALNMGVVEAVRKQTFVGTGVEKLVDSYQSAETTLGYNAFGLVKVTGIAESIDGDGNIKFANGSLSAELGDVKVPGDASLVGQNVEFYVKTTGATFTNDDRDPGKVTMTATGTVDSLISAAPVAGGMKVLATITGGVDWTKVYVDTEKDSYVADEVSGGAAYYVDGVKAASKPANTNKGVVVEFCDTEGDGEVTLVRVYNWIPAVVGADGVTTTTNKNGDVKVTVDGVTNNAMDASKIVGYEGLKEGDVVLYYGTSNVVIEKAESFTGAVASKKGSKLTVNGKTLEKGYAFITEDTVDLFAEWDTDDDTAYIWALDKNGDVIYCAAPVGATVEKKQAIVLKGGFENGSDASGLVGSAATADKANAQLLFLDGTVEVVSVVKVDSKTLNATESKLVASDMTAFNDTLKLVNYSKNDKNEYTLETVSTDAIGAETAISAAVKFDGTNEANNSTLFIIGKGNADDGYKYTTYTGFANIPGMTTNAGGLVLKDDDGFAKVVYLVASSFAGDAPEGKVYVTDATAASVAGQSYVTISAVDADGELDEAFKIASAEVLTGGEGLYTVSAVNENGVATKMDKVTPDEVTEDITAVSGVLKINGKSYQFDSKTKFIIIDLDEDGKYDDVTVAGATAMKKADYATIEIVNTTDEGKMVDLIYIVRTAAAEADA